MTREVDCIIAFVAAAKIPGIYPGYTTNGTHALNSYHERKGTPSATGSLGLAVDFDAPHNDPAALLACAHLLDSVASQLAELFHTPLGHSIKHHQRVSWTIANHVTHVHVAVDKGTFLQVPNTQTPQLEEDDMIQYKFDDGAIINMDAAGEVFCPEYEGRPTAKHWGGITQLRDSAIIGFEKAVSIAGIHDNDSQAGYIIKDQRWGQGFKFDADTLKKFGK